MWFPKSDMPGVAWPALPAETQARQLSILYQLLQTQWWPADALLKAQRRQMMPLLRHAYETVPFYRDRLRDLSHAATPQDFEAIWQALPVLTRSDIQEHGPALESTAPPKPHGRLGWIETSGTSGKPVRVRDTGLFQVMWGAASLRGYQWRKWDLCARFARIRADKTDGAPYPEGRVLKHWGPLLASSFATGPGFYLDIHTDPGKQAEWLARRQPKYLMTYASNAMHVARYCLEQGLEISSLDSLEVVSETVTEEIRETCRQAWGARVHANYSTREAGCIAVECPDTENGAYHIQSEAVLVEILDESGKPCQAGETGRVVLTPLHNFAMPLIRYDIGDYAEVGRPCACGRGLPVLAKVLGRQNALVRLPTGERFWSPFHGEVFTAVAPVHQYQIIQHALDEMEVKLVVDRRFDEDQERRLTERLQEDLRYPFRIRFTYVDAIPRTAGGKYQVFISRV